MATAKAKPGTVGVQEIGTSEGVIAAYNSMVMALMEFDVQLMLDWKFAYEVDDLMKERLRAAGWGDLVEQA